MWSLPLAACSIHMVILSPEEDSRLEKHFGINLRSPSLDLWQYKVISGFHVWTDMRSGNRRHRKIRPGPPGQETVAKPQVFHRNWVVCSW